MQDALFEVAMRVISSHCRDGGLTSVSLARDLASSVRQVQRVFRARGTSPAREIRLARVARAQEILRDPGAEGLTIEDVAQHSGFADADSMRRAFRLAAEPAPSQFRPRAQSPGVAVSSPDVPAVPRSSCQEVDPSDAGWGVEVEGHAREGLTWIAVLESKRVRPVREVWQVGNGICVEFVVQFDR